MNNQPLYKLTREQEGLWVEWKRNPQDITYNTCVQSSICGEIDLKKFQESLCATIQHFDMLGAYIVEENSKPKIAFSKAKYPIQFSDFSIESEEEDNQKKQKALKELDKVRTTPIPLDKFPLINAKLIKTAYNKFYFIGVVPHLISDGFSATLVLQALSICYNYGEQELYNRFNNKNSSWLDYLKFREEKYSNEKINKAFEYWKESLSDASHIIPIGNKLCKRSSDLAKRHRFSLNKEISLKLKKAARANKTSLFSVISASFAAFINRYYNINDLLIGHPVNLRPAGYKNSFGFFVNVIPLRIKLEEDSSFNELITKSHLQRKKDKEHQFLPYLDIVRGKRQTDPAFDGRMFNISIAETVSRLQNFHLNDIESFPLDNESMQIKDDLSLIYEVTEQGIGFWFEHLLEIFSSESIKDMSNHFLSLLEKMANEPDKNISEFDIITEKEKKELLEISLDKKNDNDSIIAAFEKIAKKFPNKEALIFNEEKISYQELSSKVNKIANFLINNVSDKGKFVPLIFASSADRIVAMLACLKAGLAYIPIEASTPIARIKNIIVDAKVKFALSNKNYDLGITNFTISEIYKSPDLTTKKTRRNDNAYVIYTSGSTGLPKGVLVKQKQVMKKLEWTRDYFPLDKNDKILQSISYSFDVSVAEIFWPLISGSTLIIPNENELKDFKAKISLIEKHKITVAYMVASSISSLLKVTEKLPFKYLISVGEHLEQNIIDEYYKKNDDGTLYNLYGPTEGVIYAAYKKILRNEKTTIGKEISGSKIIILNSKQKLQPKNAVGELCIYGNSLAEGYFHKAALTNKSFIKNPFAPGKIYKTGDLGYFNQDGQLFYLGRIDNQIKIRGYRIEIGEILAKIDEIKNIIEATIIQNEQKQLCLIYSCKNKIKQQEIKEYLEKYLPNYMIPTFFIEYKTLPKLDSGKINTKLIKKELLEKKLQINKKEKLILPKSKKEKLMAKLWSEILRLPLNMIGLNSNFFALGGDSLMVIELECLAEKNSIYLDSRAILSAKSLQDMLAKASDKVLQKFSQDLIIGEIDILPRQAKFFADNFVKQEQWLRTISLEFKKEINIELLEESFKDLLTQHDSLRLSFQQSNNIWKAFINPAINPKITIVDFSKEKKESYENLTNNFLNKESASFNLSEAPLIKILYFKYKNTFQLSLIIHHLLIDMRSIRIILEDLMMSYIAKLQNQPFIFPSKASSLKDYTEFLYEDIKDKPLSSEILYWKEQLEFANIDFQEITLFEENQIHQKISFSQEKSKMLISLAEKNNITIHQLLLAIFTKAYKACFKERRNLTVNSCFHGRDDISDHIKITKTIGWFNSVFPIKIPLDKDNFFQYIKEHFKNIPNNALNYLPLRFIKKEESLNKLAEPKIFFNYVSKIDTDLPQEFSKKLPLKILENSKNIETVSKSEKSCYALYLEAGIVDKKIEIALSYDKDIFKEEEVSFLINHIKN